MQSSFDRYYYTVFYGLCRWKVYPVFHQANAGFGFLGNQPVNAFAVNGALIFDFHAISLVEPVLQISRYAAQLLQGFPL